MSGMPQRRASGHFARAACAVAGLALCLSSLGLGAATAGSATDPLAEGVYAGAAVPLQVAAFDAATGTHSSIAADYLPANSGWAGMDGQGDSLRWMFADGWTGTPYTLELGVPIIPTDSAGHRVGTLTAGANGAYNSHFKTLARTLVAARESGAYLRLGFEFDGGWTAWNATTPASEAKFAAYFRQIVKAMRSVPGENFKFVWNPDAEAFSSRSYDVALAYPGRAYVNVIGLDAYDQAWVTPLTPANAWNEATLPALTAAQKFAAAHGKPLALSEWGTAIRTDGHGLGDDPFFVTNIIAWMRNPANHVTFEAYFDFDGRGTNSVITGGRFPRSLAAFRAGFKRTHAREIQSGSSTHVPWAALTTLVVVAGIGVGWTTRRKSNGHRAVTRTRVHPPAPGALASPQEWADQTP
jgi:hypothetical protein